MNQVKMNTMKIFNGYKTTQPPMCAQWSMWGAFGACSVTCGRGNQMRTRTCDNGVGGVDCPGSATKYQPCQLAACAYWGQWSAFTACDVTCGGGNQVRFV